MQKLCDIPKYTDEQLINADVFNIYKQNGFEILSTKKNSYLIGKKKSKATAFEDRVERLFSQCLGFNDVKKREKIGRNNVDCIAIDPDLIVIVEAKTCEDDGGEKSVKKYIDVFAGWKNDINNSLRVAGYHQQIKFIIAFEGLLPSEKSVTHANDENVIMLNEKNISLLEQLYVTVGEERASQHFYHHIEVPIDIINDNDYKEIRFPVLKSQFNNYNDGVYSAYISAKDLLDITYVHRISDGELEDYQRVLDAKRLRNIAEFINDGNSFNSSVVIAMEKPVRFKLFTDEEKNGYAFGLLYVAKQKSIARIIDGQHRIFSYVWAGRSHLNDKVPVIILTGISRAEQAKLFIDINKNQKPVDPSTLLVIMSNTDPYGIGFIPKIIRSLNKDGIFKKSVKINGMNDKPINGSKLTITGMTKDIQRRFLFDDIKSPKISVSAGSMFSAEDMENATSIINDYFDFILNGISQVKRDIIKKYVYSNVGFSILSYIFQEFVIYCKHVVNRQKFDDILKNPLQKFFEESDEVHLLELLGRPGESSFKKSSVEMIKFINNDFPAFGARLIESVREDTITEKQNIVESKKNSINNIQDEINKIEVKLKRIIKISFNDNEDELYKKLSQEVAKKIKCRVVGRTNGYMPSKTDVFNELSWEQIDTIIDEQWELVHDKIGAQLRYDRKRVVGDMDIIKRFRNDYLAHQRLELLIPEDRVNEVCAVIKRMLRVL